jgi:hypothetical protein
MRAETTVRWRPAAERPAMGTVALIALLDKSGGGWFVAEGMYVAQDDGWRCEMADEPIDTLDGYYWIPEHELLAGLRADA